jgi:multidrug efflux pump subunit AcrA (membrane-fusion protein)
MMTLEKYRSQWCGKTMKRNRGRQGVRGGLLVIVVAVALALFSGCKPPQQVAPPPPEVSIVQPVSKEVTEWDDFTGRLEPIKSVEVRPRVSGYLDSIHFKDGQVVKAGDLLFVIDPRPYEAEAERARAELKRAEAQRNLGLQNLQRAERLMQGSTIAQEQFDTRRNEYDIAAANVLEAQAAAKAAELNLEFTQVKAPIDGRISRRFADEGNFITGGSAQSTQPLCRSIRFTPPLMRTSAWCSSTPASTFLDSEEHPVKPRIL